MIDPELKERILRSLRWVVPELERRFNDCKDQLQDGSQGGYSPELKELVALKQDLEQGELMPMQAETVPTYTEHECIDTGAALGMTTRDSIDFYLQYAPQWKRPNGKLMVDLILEMRRWKLRNQDETPEPVRIAGKTPRQIEMERQG